MERDENSILKLTSIARHRSSTSVPLAAVFTVDDGHVPLSGHSPHLGTLGAHVSCPKPTKSCVVSAHSSGGEPSLNRFLVPSALRRSAPFPRPTQPTTHASNVRVHHHPAFIVPERDGRHQPRDLRTNPGQQSQPSDIRRNSPFESIIIDNRRRHRADVSSLGPPVIAPANRLLHDAVGRVGDGVHGALAAERDAEVSHLAQRDDVAVLHREQRRYERLKCASGTSRRDRRKS